MYTPQSAKQHLLFNPEELVFSSVIYNESLKQLLLQLVSTTVYDIEEQAA